MRLSAKPPGVVGAALVVLALSGCASPAAPFPAPTVEPSVATTPRSTAAPTPTLAPIPTPVPTPTPTPAPSIEPWKEPTQAELVAACTKGKGIPEASPWDGSVYPYLRVSTDKRFQDGEPSFGLSKELLPRSSGAVAFTLDNYGPGDLRSNGFAKFELLECDSSVETAAGFCHYEGNVTTHLYYETKQIRLLAARTGKLIASRTFTAGSDCPYVVYGAHDGDDYINAVRSEDDVWIDSFGKH